MELFRENKDFAIYKVTRRDKRNSYQKVFNENL
jgi:hypothetical protein